MTALLSTEALKLRTLRLSWIVAALALAASATIGFAGVRIAIDAGQPVHLTALAAAPAQAMWFLAIVAAVLASAGEFQHRTIHTTLLTSPRRDRVLIAKSAVAGAYGGLLVLLGAVAAAVTGAVTAAASGASFTAGSAAWGHVAGAVAVGALFAVLATGLGVLTRSTAAAIGGDPAVALRRRGHPARTPPRGRPDPLDTERDRRGTGRHRRPPAPAVGRQR